MKTVKDLIRELSDLKEELQDLPLEVMAKNGERHYPDIKLVLKDPYNIWDKSKENVESVYLGFD